MGDRVTVQIEAGIAEVRLARADKMNALDDAMFSALIGAGKTIASDRSVRVVVLSGEGRAFCAGLDMGSFSAMGRDASIKDLLFGEYRSESGANRAQQAAMIWRELPVPVIAAIHGPVFGAGLQVALGCDIRIARPDAQLSIMEIKWGLVPDMGGMALLRNLVRDDVARELIWTGRMISGEEAAQLGLVTRLSDAPHPDAMILAAEIVAKSPCAIRASKRLLNIAADADQREILLREMEEQAALIGSENQMEAVRANLDRRPPVFVD